MLLNAMVDVESSMMNRIAFTANNIIVIEMLNGSVYAYEADNITNHLGMIGGSVGAYYNSKIKGKFPCTPLGKAK